MNSGSHSDTVDQDGKLKRVGLWLKNAWSGEAGEIRDSAGSDKLRVKTVEVLLFVREVVKGLMGIAATGRAAALAFTTLLSLVPLIAALSLVLKAYFAQIFPELKVQLDTLLNLLLPYQSAQISYQISRAADQAAGLSTFGTVIFVLISFRLFMTVEGVVNRTWKVEGARNYRQKLRAFTMLFFWGPLVIGLSLATSSAIELNPFVGRLMASELAQFVIEIGTFFIAFTMLFWLVPATKVRLRSAVVGGGITTALFELVRAGLGIYSKWLFKGTINMIYGTLGFVIVFLIALELMWLVILLGVEITYVHQNFLGILRASARRLTDDPRFDVYFGLLALADIVRRYQSREEAPRAEQLAEDLGATDDQMLAILRRLEEAHVVRELVGSHAGWLPAADPNSIRLDEVVRELEDGGHRKTPSTVGEPPPGEAVVRHLLVSLDEAGSAALGERSLGHMVHEIHGDSPPSPPANEARRQRSEHGRGDVMRRRDE